VQEKLSIEDIIKRPFASGMTFNLKFALIPLPTLGDHGSEKDSARRGTRVQNGGLFSIVPKYFSLVYKLLLSTWKALASQMEINAHFRTPCELEKKPQNKKEHAC